MSFKISKVEKLPNWEAQVTGEVPLDFLNACRVEAIKHLKEHIELPGFRKGQIPEDILVKTVGEMRLLEETAEVALGKEYGNIVEESKLRPITRPQIAVTKLAPGIPLEFKMMVTLEPEFDLPDYKKIAGEVVEEDEAKSANGGSPDSQSEFREKKRLKIVDELVKATTIELPSKFVDAEAHHMLHHFKHDLEKANIKFETYLEQIKKTEEEVENELKEQISSRAKTELIIGKIADKEGLKTYREVFELLEKKG